MSELNRNYMQEIRVNKNKITILDNNEQLEFDYLNENTEQIISKDGLCFDYNEVLQCIPNCQTVEKGSLSIKQAEYDRQNSFSANMGY